jgi:phenylalanyl-tRNA synthetase alpha chain
MVLAKIQEILDNALKMIESANSSDDIIEIKNKFLAKKSELIGMMSLLGKLEGEERKSVGVALNSARNSIQEVLNLKNKEIEEKALEAKLASEKIDISLPSKNIGIGAKNPFYIIQDEMIEIFSSMGYDIASGPEIESDLYNFELLNIQKIILQEICKILSISMKILYLELILLQFKHVQCKQQEENQ